MLPSPLNLQNDTATLLWYRGKVAATLINYSSSRVTANNGAIYKTSLAHELSVEACKLLLSLARLLQVRQRRQLLLRCCFWEREKGKRKSSVDGPEL